MSAGKMERPSSKDDVFVVVVVVHTRTSNAKVVVHTSNLCHIFVCTYEYGTVLRTISFLEGAETRPGLRFVDLYINIFRRKFWRKHETVVLNRSVTFVCLLLHSRTAKSAKIAKNENHDE
jgi:hypothetical protein